MMVRTIWATRVESDAGSFPRACARPEANPDLIIVRVSGFGQTGPYAPLPGFGTLVEAMSGLAN
jgi:hypothetical protein